MAVTLRDIAKEVNITHATVSRALSNHPKISDITKKKVQLAVQKLGYRPNRAGVSLRSGKTMTVGVLVPSLENPYFVGLIRILEDQCKKINREVLVMESELKAEQEYLKLSRMLDQQVDAAVVFVSEFKPVSKLIEEYWARRIPCVVVGLPPDVGSQMVDGVRVELGSGTRKAVNLLVKFGHFNIVMAASWAPRAGDCDRLLSFKSAFKENSLVYSEKNVFFKFTGDQIEDGYNSAKSIMETMPETTAILGVNDFHVVGIMKALSDMGINVPNDVSVIGTDNTWIGKNWPVPFTTIDLQRRKQVECVMGILVDRFNSENWVRPIQKVVEAELIVRDSTGPARSGV